MQIAADVVPTVQALELRQEKQLMSDKELVHAAAQHGVEKLVERGVVGGHHAGLGGSLREAGHQALRAPLSAS